MKLTSTLLMVFVFIKLVKSQGPHQDNDSFDAAKRAPIPPIRCGRQSKDHPLRLPLSEGSKYLVINGDDANAHSWPWMVVIKANGHFVCGGTVIAGNGFNSSLILTAAHCLSDVDQNNISKAAYKISSLEIFQVCAKAHKRGECPEPRNVTKVDVHPEYHRSPWSSKYDIAVITLAQPLQFSDSIRPICLRPDQDAAPPCMITGWGTTDERESQLPSTLQQLSMQPDSEACEKWYEYGKANYTSGICASAPYGARSGKGDSGGPLACKAKSGEWYQVGVLSVTMKSKKAFAGFIYATLIKFVNCTIDTCQFVY